MTGRRTASAALALVTTLAGLATVATASGSTASRNNTASGSRELPATPAVVLAAHADPLTDAETQARQLQAEVGKLQLQVEQASERYDGAQASLVQLVLTQEQATRAATAATQAVDHARAVADTTTRALYMSGGLTGLYASVLERQESGATPGRLAQRPSRFRRGHRRLVHGWNGTAGGRRCERSGRELAHQAG